jgi:hypothetical protein
MTTARVRVFSGRGRPCQLLASCQQQGCQRQGCQRQGCQRQGRQRLLSLLSLRCHEPPRRTQQQ